MTTKTKKNETKKDKKSGAEKPVSLWGASFKDVLQALLKTKPMPKKKNQEKKQSN
jgi:hypothetical protein